MDLEQVGADWERLGANDPLWAVCSFREAKGGRWDFDELMATGRAEVDELMRYVEGQGVEVLLHRALDFGCGVGRLTAPLASYFEEVCGVDVSSSMLQVAEGTNTVDGRCRYFLNKRPDLATFDDEFFDFAYSTIVFQHLPPDLTLGYLREFFRVLRPGAVCVFTLPSSPARTWKGALYRVVPHGLIGRYKRMRDGYGATMEMNAIEKRRVLAFVHELGFQVVDVSASTSAGPNWNAFRYFLRKPEGA